MESLAMLSVRWICFFLVVTGGVVEGLERVD
jgi:hypothetical protein